MMSTRLKVGVLVVVMLGIAALLLRQQQQIRRFVAENADLRNQLSEMASLQDTNGHLAEQLKAAGETSQANQNELMRLRGQGVRSRQLEQENTQLKAQRQQLTQQMREGQLAVASSEQPQVTPASDIKATSLGDVDVSDGKAIRHDLGDGKICTITPRVLGDGVVELTARFEQSGRLLGTQVVCTRTNRTAQAIVGDTAVDLTPYVKQ